MTTIINGFVDESPERRMWNLDSASASKGLMDDVLTLAITRFCFPNPERPNARSGGPAQSPLRLGQG